MSEAEIKKIIMYKTLKSFTSVIRVGNVLILDNKFKVFISEESGLRGVKLSGDEIVMQAEAADGRTFLYLAKPAETLTFNVNA